MHYKLKFVQKEIGYRITGVKCVSLTDMQLDGKCDSCNKDLPLNTRVLGKSIHMSKGMVDMTQFSPTCLTCADLN